MNPMAVGVLIAEVIFLAFSLILTLRLKSAARLKRLAGFLLYFLLINGVAFIIAFAVDKIVVLMRR
jgi:uncharacterized membrane protein